MDVFYNQTEAGKHTRFRCSAILINFPVQVLDDAMVERAKSGTLQGYTFNQVRAATL